MADLKSFIWISVLDPPPGGPYTSHDWFHDNVMYGAARVFAAYPFAAHFLPTPSLAVEMTTYLLQKFDLTYQQHVVIKSITNPAGDPAPYVVWFSEIPPGQ